MINKPSFRSLTLREAECSHCGGNIFYEEGDIIAQCDECESTFGINWDADHIPGLGWKDRTSLTPIETKISPMLVA